VPCRGKATPSPLAVPDHQTPQPFDYVEQLLVTLFYEYTAQQRAE
jgi:hypothetical protein